MHRSVLESVVQKDSDSLLAGKAENERHKSWVGAGGFRLRPVMNAAERKLLSAGDGDDR
eukprot:COSAG04_NODE_10722_length_757_cov_0.960486_2_plen_59_part_00